MLGNTRATDGNLVMIPSTKSFLRKEARHANLHNQVSLKDTCGVHLVRQPEASNGRPTGS